MTALRSPSMSRLGGVAAVAALLSACASAPPNPYAGPGFRPMANLFISPAGQPFRGRPGEPYPSAAWFAQVDRDHDGRVTATEFRSDAEAFFRMLDTDHNGIVDGFEIADYEQSVPEIMPRVAGLRPGEGQDPTLGARGGGEGRRMQQGGGRQVRRGGGGGGARRGAGPFTFLDQPQPVAAADTDFDQKVSLAEALAAADRRFAILDVNKDGALTLAELPKTPVQAAAEGRRNPDRSRVRPGTARGAPTSSPRT